MVSLRDLLAGPPAVMWKRWSAEGQDVVFSASHILQGLGYCSYVGMVSFRLHSSVSGWPFNPNPKEVTHCLELEYWKKISEVLLTLITICNLCYHSLLLLPVLPLWALIRLRFQGNNSFPFLKWKDSKDGQIHEILKALLWMNTKVGSWIDTIIISSRAT